MTRFYRYQGPQNIARAVAGHPTGYVIRSVEDVQRWIDQTAQQANREGMVEAKFVITQQGALCLADRHSEHVACAGGKAVCSAGELFLIHDADGWAVSDVSNQSTGYCPEPDSWAEVAAALDFIPLPHPTTFTDAYLFR